MRRSLAALVVLLGSALAAAAPTGPTARLVYELGPGAESCPGAASLTTDVAARLGYDPFVESAPRRVVVRITAQPRSLRALVQLRDAQGVVRGERELSSAERDCRELSSAVAFAVSVALDPLAAMRPADSSAPAASSAPPAASSAPVASAPSVASAPIASAPATASASPAVSSAPVPPAPERSQARLRAALGAQVAFGAAPSPAPGLAAQVGVGWPRWSLSLEGRLDGTASKQVAAGRVDSALLLGMLVPCAHVGPLLGCGVLAAGGLRGSGAGVDRPRAATTFFAAAGPRLAVEWALVSPLAFRAWVDGLASLTRTRQRIDGVEAWRTPPVSVSLGIGLAMRFP